MPTPAKSDITEVLSLLSTPAVYLRLLGERVKLLDPNAGIQKVNLKAFVRHLQHRR